MKLFLLQTLLCQQNCLHYQKFGEFININKSSLLSDLSFESQLRQRFRLISIKFKVRIDCRWKLEKC